LLRRRNRRARTATRPLIDAYTSGSVASHWSRLR
jgi:hypothetical protein